MKYEIEISSTAQLTSPDRASQWYVGLLKAIASRSSMPRRCALAREDKNFSHEIRQLRYGRGRGAYRIIFTILADRNEGVIRILHIRHASQRAIGATSELPEEP